MNKSNKCKLEQNNTEVITLYLSGVIREVQPVGVITKVFS